MPTDRTSLAREIRYCQSYLQAHRLLQSAKWLGELLITISSQQNYQISSKSSLNEPSPSEDHPMGGLPQFDTSGDMNRVTLTDAADEVFA